MSNLSSNFASMVIGLFIIALLKKILGSWNMTKGPYPPGPKPKFLIGNALDLPMSDIGQHFMDVGAQLQSGLVHLNILGNHILFINKKNIADDLLEKRARIYSGRPHLAAVEALGWDTTDILTMDYGEEWRKHRKVAQQHLNKQQTRTYEPIQLRHLHKMLQRLLHSPEDFMQHTEVLSTAIVMDIMYGYKIDQHDDPANVAAEKMVDLAVPLLLPSGALMNVLPFLRHIPAWIPGNIAGKRVKECVFWMHEMRGIPMADLRKRMDQGMATHSAVSACLEKNATSAVDTDPDAERVVCNIAWASYSAAVETAGFFYAMLMHPRVQIKAQAEIDSIIGTGRLPTFADRPSLPYIEAIYREVMRYAPPLYIDVTHSSTEDDWYDGYFIPKGTSVFANLWAMTHDESVYCDPNSFNPERFLDQHGKLNDDDQILAYGFGRRACVGKHVASATMWITIVSVLACFMIERAKDELGNEIEVNDECEYLALVRHKKPFKCRFVRSEGARRLVEETASVEGAT
ncbi:hypothetical protein NLJ89_g3095 [Agrocybe chaxingu]|uniref:Cytochrome P450 n=1 Tax=Agrocybe chaxingu TaxID=84603 RepID=A0A9W8MYM0_9AGAR|nr:hypothetical protein NLJ89_g3095 [Agrocybe chaxingu]